MAKPERLRRGPWDGDTGGTGVVMLGTHPQCWLHHLGVKPLSPCPGFVIGPRRILVKKASTPFDQNLSPIIPL